MKKQAATNGVNYVYANNQNVMGIPNMDIPGHNSPGSYGYRQPSAVTGADAFIRIGRPVLPRRHKIAEEPHIPTTVLRIADYCAHMATVTLRASSDSPAISFRATGQLSARRSCEKYQRYHPR